MILPSGPEGWQWVLAAVIGGVALLVALSRIVAAQLSAGKTDAQRAHEKAVKGDLRALKKASSTPIDEVTRIDLEYLPTQRETEKRRDRARPTPTGPPVVRGWKATDANGAPIYLLSVGGHRLAHRELDALVADAVTVIEADGEPPTLSEYYYDDVAQGLVDIDETRRRVRGDCLTRIRENARREGEVEREKLVRMCVEEFRYPREVVEEKLDQLEGRDLRTTKDGQLRNRRYS